MSIAVFTGFCCKRFDPFDSLATAISTSVFSAQGASARERRDSQQDRGDGKRMAQGFGCVTSEEEEARTEGQVCSPSCRHYSYNDDTSQGM